VNREVDWRRASIRAIARISQQPLLLSRCAFSPILQDIEINESHRRPREVSMRAWKDVKKRRWLNRLTESKDCLVDGLSRSPTSKVDQAAPS
jgi:hypothetical protein